MHKRTTTNGEVNPRSHKAARKPADRPTRPEIPWGEQHLLLTHLETFLRLGDGYLKEYGRHHEFGNDLANLLPALRTFHDVLESGCEQD